MVVNNLVSIVQIYCRHLFPHTKWEICQLSVIKFQNIFDDSSGMRSVLSKIGSSRDLFRFRSRHTNFTHDSTISCCFSACFRLLGSRGVKFRHGLILKQVYLSVWIGTPVFDFFLNSKQ